MPSKKNIIEDLGNHLIDANASIYVEGYRKSLSTAREELTTKVAKGTRPTLRGLKTNIPIKGVNVATRGAFVMGQVQLFVLNPRNPNFRAIKQLAGMYNVNNPKLFTVTLVKLAKNNVSKIPLKPKERLAAKLFNKVVDDNRETIQQLLDENTKALKSINKKITTNQSKAMIKRRRQLIRERVEVGGIKRPLTNKEIATRLTGEFRDDKARLERILDTETHRQNELVKEVVASEQGLKFKIWNTQRDSKVRESHAKLDRKRIRIKSRFNVGGFKGSFPSDPRLPPQESIRCRCFLTFE